MPRLSGNWEQKARALGPGLTVLRTAQCPYLGPAADHARAAAAQFGLPFSDHFIHSAEELRRVSPTPYGVYALVRDGKVISTHHLREEHLVKRLQAGQD